MMLVHFPTALYPFSVAMDIAGQYTLQQSFHDAACYALIGGITTSLLAMVYGAIDFLKIGSSSNAWKIAGVHALLNVIWFLLFGLLLAYRLKHSEDFLNPIYLILSGLAVIGLFISNYLGGELVVKYRIGID